MLLDVNSLSGQQPGSPVNLFYSRLLGLVCSILTVPSQKVKLAEFIEPKPFLVDSECVGDAASTSLWP